MRKNQEKHLQENIIFHMLNMQKEYELQKQELVKKSEEIKSLEQKIYEFKTNINSLPQENKIIEEFYVKFTVTGLSSPEFIYKDSPIYSFSNKGISLRVRKGFENNSNVFGLKLFIDRGPVPYTVKVLFFVTKWNQEEVVVNKKILLGFDDNTNGRGINSLISFEDLRTTNAYNSEQDAATFGCYIYPSPIIQQARMVHV